MRKRLFSTALALLSLACLCVVSASAQKRGPSTPEERAQTVRLARALETDPLNDSARPARAWLITFLTDVPDVNVTICTDLFGPLLKTKKDYAPELVTQPMFSEAAFIIEHPDKANDETAVHIAGVEGMLKAYESILKAKPKAHHQFLDDLIVKRDKGELASFVADIVKNKCSGPKTKEQ
jgi:hypothetical protein